MLVGVGEDPAELAHVQRLGVVEQQDGAGVEPAGARGPVPVEAGLRLGRCAGGGLERRGDPGGDGGAAHLVAAIGGGDGVRPAAVPGGAGGAGDLRQVGSARRMEDCGVWPDADAEAGAGLGVALAGSGSGAGSRRWAGPRRQGGGRGQQPGFGVEVVARGVAAGAAAVLAQIEELIGAQGRLDQGRCDPDGGKAAARRSAAENVAQVAVRRSRSAVARRFRTCAGRRVGRRSGLAWGRVPGQAPGRAA